MVREVSEFHEEPETELGCSLTHFQVLHECSEGDLHDQCDREPEFHLPETEPSEERISRRHRPAKGLVSGNLRGHEEMDYAHPQLGSGIWRVEYHVRGAPTRIKQVRSTCQSIRSGVRP